ncbi:MFS transporter [Rhodococcus opacus]|uniref:MFS transporter n=1 Tax=Rhodococcus opacus TaxID=37919 RepID=UPI001C475B63|nr:MFS transporter [Rhodococcus opacus]MBV6760437.1 MFS transporter [Rhodococcus opacus]
MKPPSGSPADVISPMLRTARWSTFALLFLNGFGQTSWIIHTPSFVKNLNLSLAQLGFAISAIGIGSILIIPAIGFLLTRFGIQAGAAAAFALFGAGLLLVGTAQNYQMFLVGLIFGGAGSAAVESCGSTSGSRVEHAFKKPMMPAFIGAMAAGSVVGTLFGAILLAFDVPPRLHLSIVCIIILVCGFALSFKLIPGKNDPTTGRRVRVRPTPSWRLAGICMIILVSVVEGAAFGFAAVYMADDLGATAAVAALGVTFHTLGTATAQLSGNWLRARFSPAVIVRVLVILGGSVMGGALYLGSIVPALIGFFAFGASVAFVYPAGLSAAADTQPTPAPGITVAQTVRYLGAFGAAPLLGAIVDATNLTQMFIMTIVFSVVLTLLLAGILGTRPGLTAREGGELPDFEATSSGPELANVPVPRAERPGERVDS